MAILFIPDHDLLNDQTALQRRICSLTSKIFFQGRELGISKFTDIEVIYFPCLSSAIAAGISFDTGNVILNEAPFSPNDIVALKLLKETDSFLPIISKHPKPDGTGNLRFYTANETEKMIETLFTI